MQQKVLILGAKGMLGQELVRVFSEDVRYEVYGWDREDINVSDTDNARNKIVTLAPSIIVNAVAYNAVDACEESDEEYTKALALNADAPRFLASLAKDMDVIFVHYSTDYVFGDAMSNEIGFDEKAMPKPNCRYAMSKLAGEVAIQEVGGKCYIIRLSKLFGKPATSAIAKKSFFEVMLNVGKTKDEVNAVDEELSCFTYAPDLAKGSKDLIESGDEFGIYHLINESPATWYGGVVELYKQAELTTKINPVSSDAFPRPAKRPVFSVLLNTKRPKLRKYQGALGEFLGEKR